MLSKANVTVCSDIRTKHSTQSEHHVEFLNIKPWWYVKKPLGFKRLNVREIFSLLFPPPKRPDRSWVLPSFLFNGYRNFFSVAETDPSPSSGVEIKNVCSFVSIPSYAFLT